MRISSRTNSREASSSAYPYAVHLQRTLKYCSATSQRELSSETGVVVLKLLLKMARDHGKTIIIVTHNQNIAKMADVVIHIRSGKVTSVEEQPHPLAAEEVDW